MKWRRIFSFILCFVLAVNLITPVSNSTNADAAYNISTKEINSFFGNSAIIGNSVGVGLRNYFNTKPKGYLGSPKMLVWECYSFMNDFFENTKYMIHYKGQPYKGRNAVKACGAKHVFINMGVNDLNSSQHNTYNHYVRYINEIKSTNPNVDIFILATTPARRTSGLLNNHEINKLNNKMKKLCKSKKDMYYIDINTPLKDSTGSLKSSYASDGYVHLTFPAYKVWTDTMVKYIKNHLKNQKKAKALVKKVGKTLKSSDYTKAKKAVDYLAKSKCKSTLKVKLKQIKKKIKKQQQKTNKKTEAKKTTTETPDNPTTETPSTTEATTSEASSETLVTSSTTEELPTTESNSIEE